MATHLPSSRNGTKNNPVVQQQKEPWHVSHWALEPRQRMEERPSESLQSQSFQALHPPLPVRYAQHTAYDVNDEIDISSRVDDTLRDSDDEQQGTSKKSKKQHHHHSSKKKKKSKQDDHHLHESSSKSKTSSKESSSNKKKKHRPPPTEDDDSDHMYPVDEDSPFAVEFRQTSPNAPAWNAPPATTPIEAKQEDEKKNDNSSVDVQDKKDGNDMRVQEEQPKEQPQEQQPPQRREPGVKFNPEAVVYEMEEESIENLVEYLQHQHDLEVEEAARGGYGDASNDDWAEFPDNGPGTTGSADENDVAHGKVKELPISSSVQCTSWALCLIVLVGFGVGLGIVAWKTYFQNNDSADIGDANTTLTPTMAVTIAPIPTFATAVPTMARTPSTSAPVPSAVFTPVPTQYPSFVPSTLEE